MTKTMMRQRLRVRTPQQRIQALRAEIESVDPLPFAHEYSEWVDLFENLEAGACV
jgi:hypothetical protein